MSELNESQRRLAETLDGMVVVDAGPGTGKTHTIVERYLNLVSRDDVSVKDVLLLTFTNNAAAEMDRRVKAGFSERTADGRLDPAKMRDVSLIRAQTFDSFCLSVVMDSPEQVGRLFGIHEGLTRDARIVQNDSLNREWFRMFLDDFLLRHEGDYPDWAAVACESSGDVLAVIERLMSRGVYPLRNGWFGVDWKRQLLGDPDSVMGSMTALDGSKLSEALKEGASHTFAPMDWAPGGQVPESAMREAACEDRTELIGFIHDVYHEYIERSIASDRLTFGITSMLAMGLLYSDASVRERNSFGYVMIDEFQDTNANQLMIALMILRRPNLCVVGDWKQGIYGFRFVSIDNIVNFEQRVVDLRRFLNDDSVRVPFHVPETIKLSLDTNYRSSRMVLDCGFESMFVRATKDETVDRESLAERIVSLCADRSDMGGNTDVRFVHAADRGSEPDMVARTVMDYMSPGRYGVLCEATDPDTGLTGTFSRPMRYGDIAVLCRTVRGCTEVMEGLQARGIPAYLQGDVELMSTREGKLALAWLRFVSNMRDPWGYVPIMLDMGYSLTACHAVRDRDEPLPTALVIQQRRLESQRRRVTELLTSIYDFYGLDNDVTQAIISVLSSIHRESLSTISDLIRLIESDIENGSKYPVETTIDRDAVRIMTMHKAKGLEFPAVIIPFVDDKVIPNIPRIRERFFFTESAGIRCSKEVHDFGGYRREVDSWRTALVKKAEPRDYGEERRLLFVAMTRAKQYETLICGDRPSLFMNDLLNGLGAELLDDVPQAERPESCDGSFSADRPDLEGYVPRRPRFGVHEMMDFDEDGQGSMSDDRRDERSEKGRKYGTAVHDAAYCIFRGIEPEGMEDYPELDEIRRIVARARSKEVSLAEEDCVLPVEGTDVVLRGRLDLACVGDGVLEIHDYKTDETDRFESEYRFQLSVYAWALKLSDERFSGTRAVCCIDYVSLGRTVEFDPWPMERIREKVESKIRRMGMSAGQ